MKLAEKTNVCINHIQRIETAAYACTLDTLIDISEALNIPLKNYLNIEINLLLKAYKKLGSYLFRNRVHFLLF